MRVLNFEDTPIKHRAIRNVLESCRVYDVDCVRNLEDGIIMYMETSAILKTKTGKENLENTLQSSNKSKYVFYFYRIGGYKLHYRSFWELI